MAIVRREIAGFHTTDRRNALAASLCEENRGGYGITGATTFIVRIFGIRWIQACSLAAVFSRASAHNGKMVLGYVCFYTGVWVNVIEVSSSECLSVEKSLDGCYRFLHLWENSVVSNFYKYRDTFSLNSTATGSNYPELSNDFMHRLTMLMSLYLSPLHPINYHDLTLLYLFAKKIKTKARIDDLRIRKQR